LLSQAWRSRKRFSLVLVTEGGHRLVPFVRIWSECLRKKVVFDPFLSRYNTRVEDRQWHRPGSLKGLACWYQDWSSTHAAHALLFDTHEHQALFYTRYGLSKPYAIVPIGVDEAAFAEPDAPRAISQHGLNVLFYGTYIPLQGIEYILAAAKELRMSDIEFRLIGEGQTYDAMRRIATEYSLSNVTFEASKPLPELPGFIRDADVSLGVFAPTLKAQNVVPNKVVQAAAMGACIVSAGTPALARYFTDGVDIATVPAGDSKALAHKLTYLAAHPDERRRLGEGARRVFLRHFSRARQATILRDFLLRLSEQLKS
jgi:glycosyltransferase involved in cell wall biosynthesis